MGKGIDTAKGLEGEYIKNGKYRIKIVGIVRHSI